MEQATPERHALQISSNREAQHRYLTWRAEKVVTVFSPVLFRSTHTFGTFRLKNVLKAPYADLFLKLINLSLLFACDGYIVPESIRKYHFKLTIALGRVRPVGKTLGEYQLINCLAN